MRIAFDLDDTLVPCGYRFATEEPPIRAIAWLAATPRLREGSSRLLRELRKQGWEIWVYTSSQRSPFSIFVMFLAYGIVLDGVVNDHRHERERRRGAIPGRQKHPPAFGIDVLVDDSCAVSEHARSAGFEVIRVDPTDARWVERVIQGAERRHRSRAPLAGESDVQTRA